MEFYSDGQKLDISLQVEDDEDTCCENITDLHLLSFDWSWTKTYWWKHKEMLPILSKLASRTNLETGKVESIVIINKNKKLINEYKQYKK